MRQPITTITLITAASCFIISGCSRSAENIEGTYVSPLVYQSYDCDQLTQEATRVGHRVQKISGKQDEQAGDDNVALGVGIIFWPALLFLLDSDKEEELGQLKGELEGMEQAAILKNCTSLLEKINKGKEAAEETAKET